MVRLRSLATLAVAFVVLLLAACGGGSTENTVLPHEGTWRLVRLNGQPLPVRLDTVEVVSEDVRFIFTGSGFVRQTSRRYPPGSESAPLNGVCEAWFGYQVVGAQISTVPAANQGPSGICPRQVVSRAYILDGDTLRSDGTTGFITGAIEHAYVRVSRD